MKFILYLFSDLDVDELRRKVSRETSSKYGITTQRIFAPVALGRSQPHLSLWINKRLELPRNLLIQLSLFLESPLAERKLKYSQWERANPPNQRPDKRKSQVGGLKRMKWSDQQKKVMKKSMDENPNANPATLSKALSSTMKVPEDSVKIYIKNMKSKSLKK